MTIAEAKKIVANKYKLGNTLVTGHAAKYWEEAMKIFKDGGEDYLSKQLKHFNG